MDKVVLEQTINKYADMVYRILFCHLGNKADSDDAFQDVFIKLYKCNKEFESDEHLKAYLIKMTANIANDYHRKNFWRNKIELQDIYQAVSDCDDDNYEVMDAILHLPNKYKNVIYMYYFEDYKANEIAGILNILLICGWTGIYISKEKSKDMMWPDMDWIYILGYDLWNFAYTYNCISDHSVYCGVILLLSCTIPAFFIKKGCWLQHRAHTLALWIMFIMTVPQFADRLAPVPTTHNPKAFFAVSFLSLVVNAAAVIYQFSVIRKNKLNPFKDEIYTDKAFYKKINAENK